MPRSPRLLNMLAAREALADAIYPEGRDRRETAERMANTDALTGLANRRALDLALPQAERDPGTAIVLFDGDSFGRVNKLFGHSVGDEVIKDLAFIIRDEADRHGYGNRVFRAGGDEFVVLIPFHYSGLLRDGVEVSYARVKRPVSGVGVTGVIGSTFDEADKLLAGRKKHRKERRRAGCEELTLYRREGPA